MSKPQDIMNQIVTQLKNSSALSYVEDANIFKGKRDNPIAYPCIFVEPMGSTEEDYAYPKERIKYRFDILAIVSCHDNDSQISGDGASIKGIMDIENDIKLALDSDRTLAGTAIHLDILGSDNGQVEGYPLRMTVVSVEVFFEQTLNIRT